MGSANNMPLSFFVKWQTRTCCEFATCRPLWRSEEGDEANGWGQTIRRGLRGKGLRCRWLRWRPERAVSRHGERVRGLAHFTPDGNSIRATCNKPP